MAQWSGDLLKTLPKELESVIGMLPAPLDVQRLEIRLQSLVEAVGSGDQSMSATRSVEALAQRMHEATFRCHVTAREWLGERV